MAFWVACSIVFTSQLLLQRYYLHPEDIGGPVVPLQWSQSLNSSQPLHLKFNDYQVVTPAKLRGLSIYIDGDTGSERVMMQLHVQNGSDIQVVFQVPQSTQARYFPITVPEGPYVSASISSPLNTNLRTGQVSNSRGGNLSCLIYELDDGSRRYTPGCP